jgi:hypothetical protein
LQSDPNSPLLGCTGGMEGDWVGAWSGFSKKPTQVKSKDQLLSVVERARERRERERGELNAPQSIKLISPKQSFLPYFPSSTPID